LERPDWRFDIADDLSDHGNQIAAAGKLSELFERSHRHPERQSRDPVALP
jgi:hypothetical protein